MKAFKDYTIEDFTERVKMPETDLVGKRVVVTSFKVKSSTCSMVNSKYNVRNLKDVKWENS